MNWLNRFSLKQWMLIAAVPLLWCALMNRGFFASDEYWTGIVQYIPAQTSHIDRLVEGDAVKSPSQVLPFFAMAQLALALGMNEPFAQYCFLLSVLGILSTAILLFSFYKLPLSDLEKKTGFLLLGFHFATAICFTRPMFESLSASFVAAAAVCALIYERKKLLKALILGVIFSSIAFLLRPQAGAVALTFLFLPLWKKQIQHLLVAAGTGIVCFVVAGLIDLAMMGEFHGSLKKVLFYNIDHGAEYGAQPFYFFLPLTFAMGFGFWTLKSFWNPQVRKAVGEQKSLIFMLGIFILVHSLFANKFERFLIPILPAILILIIPAVADILTSVKVSRFRKYSFLIVNGCLFVCTALFEPQGPIIDLVRFANRHEYLAQFVSFNGAVSWYPEVFQNRKLTVVEYVSLENKLSCNDVIVARSYDVESVMGLHPRFSPLESLFPGPIDWIAYKLNPDHNQRRAPLVLLGCNSHL